MGQGPAVWVAMIGVASTMITTVGLVLVAIVNNRKERSDSAEQGALKAMEERLMGRDERIHGLEEDNANLREQLQGKDRVITELRIDNSRLREEIITLLRSDS